MTALLFVLALLLILVAAELFTNAVEWTGRRFGLDEGATGSVLAAIGTALPETMVPIMALAVLGGEVGDAIGIGAIMGSPFMLSSLAMCVTGAAVLGFAAVGTRSRSLRIRPALVRRDLLHFFGAYGLALVAGLLHLRPLNWLLATALVGLYVHYVWSNVRREGAHEGECGALRFYRRLGPPPTWLILLQLLLALAGIVYGAQLFVEQVRAVAEYFGAAPLVVALLISPTATELPEMLNSVIWIRRRRDTLSLSNITGAMVFQSTFPVSIGLVFTSWMLPFTALLSGLLAMAAGAALYLTLRIGKTLTWWSLLAAGSAYLAYLTYVVFAL